MADTAKSNFFDGSDSDEEATAPKVSAEEVEFAQADVIKAKENGGQHFKDQNFEEALACYTTCVNTLKKAGLPRDPVILANRSATYLALKRYVPACHDAMQSAEVDPTNWKAHWRQGVAIMAMQAKKFRTKQAIEVPPATMLPPPTSSSNDATTATTTLSSSNATILLTPSLTPPPLLEQAFEKCGKCANLPDAKQNDVREQLYRAKARLAEQDEATPMPDMSNCAPS